MRWREGFFQGTRQQVEINRNDQTTGENSPSEIPLKSDQPHNKCGREENPVGADDEMEYSLLNVQVGPVRPSPSLV